MTDGKKRRMSMLDGLASSKAPLPSPANGSDTGGLAETPETGSLLASNRALRSARDAVDGHRVWDLDPSSIDDTRIADRLDPEDVADLRDAIETNGQTVPILVRRNPSDPERYLLVYGRRRVEAIRSSSKVAKVRALVATLDDDAAVRAQVSENMARRDLTFIEKALFARQLVNSGFGTQSDVAEVLTVAKSAISMALAIVDMVTPELADAIGPAQGKGRPRWDALGHAVRESRAHVPDLVALAEKTHLDAMVAPALSKAPEPSDPSVAAFEAVMREVGRPAPAKSAPTKKSQKSLMLNGNDSASIVRTEAGLRLGFKSGPFADWLEQEAESILTDLHARWTRRAGD